MLSILASFAQEESLSVSENCKWRIRRDFAAGEGNSFDMYGYKIRGGEYEIVPEEADVVRQIYSWYLDGVGTGRIAIMLNAMRIPPCRGSLWNRTTIMSVLRNEKYTGNILLQKTFISDHLTKKKRVNRGELPQYYVEDSHEAIIDKSTFDKVQEELKRRAEQYETASSVVKERNPLAQKITCGICGKHFIRRRRSGYSTTENHAKDYILNNYSSINVADISMYLGIDRSYFSAIFKQAEGITPSEYLLQVRMRKSAQMLRNPTLSIQEIARNVGYEDSLTFSKAFKRFFGVSPKYFRTTSADDRPEMDAIIAARRENVKQE